MIPAARGFSVQTWRDDVRVVPGPRGAGPSGRDATVRTRKSRRLRSLLALSIGTAFTLSLCPAEGARAAPSRPSAAATAGPAPAPAAALPTKKIGSIEYVNVTDVAHRLSLKLTWIERGKKLRLTGASARAELERDTRDVEVNGLRVFLGDPIVDAGGTLYVSRIDFERALTPALRAGHGVKPMASLRTIVLDPGHGGKDNGTSVNEKTYALDVAKRAKKSLEKLGYRVVLTRETDTFLELPERAAVANANKAGLFVSIHFNALPNDRRTSGVEVFTFAPRFQHAAEWWSLLRRDDPHLERTDMPVNRFDHWNVVLAQAIHRRFVVDLKSFDRGRKLAHWGVLRGLNCPGVLVECGFLTSDVESRKIATTAHRQKLADAIVAGIRDYAGLVEPLPRAKTAAVARRSGSAR